MIVLENVTVSKAGHKLFENFSFRIAEGEHWVIQGDNGSGKTLLLQLLAGTLHPLSGRVHHSFIEGDDWDSLFRQRQEKIHFIPTQWVQAYLSGFDDLFYQQRYYSIEETALPKVKDVFGADVNKLETLDFSDSFDIRPLLDLHLTRLSNGQLKKVVIIRQLVKNIPKVLLLDYPFDGLDTESRRDLAAFVEALTMKFGIQLVMTDHGSGLPKTINRRLVLHGFAIQRTERISAPGNFAATTSPANTTEQTNEGEPVVEMKHLTIQYSGKRILSNVNWRIQKGDRWALTGRNGSGKTTLFSLIYADHPMAYSQQVFLFGKRRGSGESIWDIKKRINYFGPEQIHFLNAEGTWASGRQYIMQSHKDLSRLATLVDFFHAHRYIDQPLMHLSSGQLQMVMLINMFLDDRELLLLDEPFQFLDPVNHRRVTDYLNHYLHKDITLVLITHDENDVAQWTRLRKRI